MISGRIISIRCCSSGDMDSFRPSMIMEISSFVKERPCSERRLEAAIRSGRINSRGFPWQLEITNFMISSFFVRHKKLLYFFRIWFNWFIKSEFGFAVLVQGLSFAIIIGISFENRSLFWLSEDEGDEWLVVSTKR